MKYNKDKLKKHIEEVSEMYDYLKRSVVYEPQEGQAEHFDNISKSEQVALIGIFNDLGNTLNSLTSYQHWFGDDKK